MFWTTDGYLRSCSRLDKVLIFFFHLTPFFSYFLSPFLNSSSKGTAGDVPIKHVSQGLLLQLAPLASHIHPYGIWSRRPVRYFVPFHLHIPPTCWNLFLFLLTVSIFICHPTLPFSHRAVYLSLFLSVMWCLPSCKKAIYAVSFSLARAD